MDRRLLLTALACWPAARALAQQEPPRPRYRISAAQLYEALSSRFPVRLDLALLKLQVSAPQLHLLPARNKLGAMLVAQASGTGLAQPQTGALDVLFGLRYEPSDRTIRAREPEVLDLRLPGVAPEAVLALQGLLPQVARQAVGEIVLHAFTARELALPDAMGVEPDKLTVLDDGLLVEFAPKPWR